MTASTLPYESFSSQVKMSSRSVEISYVILTASWKAFQHRENVIGQIDISTAILKAITMASLSYYKCHHLYVDNVISHSDELSKPHTPNHQPEAKPSLTFSVPRLPYRSHAIETNPQRK
jgi:hypothetical protein